MDGSVVWSRVKKKGKLCEVDVNGWREDEG